jgi:DNA-binding CsgD family transcriptional regulator/mono/diheme cytochrome c family protein
MASTEMIGAGVVRGGLLERERELAEIERLLDGVRSGSGELLVVDAPPGVGKTRLLEALHEAASEHGMTVLAATGSELERELAFGVVRSLFGPLLAPLPPAHRRALLAGAARWAAPVLAVEPSDGDVRAADPGSVLHGLFWLTSNLAERGPVVIVIDDAHWADMPSLRFVAYLARRLEDLGALVAVAVRTREPAGGANILASLANAEGAHLMRPGTLSARAVATLVRERLAAEPDQEFCAACHAASGGNPFLVGELLAAVANDGLEPIAPNARRIGDVGPSAVARMVLTRLTRIGRGATALAEAVAVFGTGVELRHAVALAGLDLDTAARAVDALCAIEVLAAGRPLRFVHPLVRNAIYQSIGPAERSMRHAAAARFLAVEGASPDRVAAHLLKAEPAGEEWVVGALRLAASYASTRGAPDEAGLYLRRALAEPPAVASRAEVLHELGAAELLARDPAAVDHLAQALAAAAAPEERGEVALLLGRAAVQTGRLADARKLLGEAIEELGEARPAVVARLEAYRSASGVWDPRFGADLEGDLPRLRALADRAGAGGFSLLAMIAFRLAFEGGRQEEIVALIERALDQGTLIQSEAAEAIEITWAVRALTFIDELDHAERLLNEVVADSRKRGSVMGYAAASAWRADISLRRGQIAAGEADARAAIELATAHGLHFIAPHAHSFLGEALIEQGDLEQAATLLEHADLGPMQGTHPEVRFLNTRGRARLARGDQQAALEDLRACQAQPFVTRNPNMVAWRTTLALALPEDSREEALSLAQAELDDARRIGQPRAIGVALRTQALLSDRDVEIELLQEAAKTLASCPSRLEQARGLTDLGAALRRAGRRTGARQPLREGLDLASACGATALATRAREELVAAGARPRRQRTSGQEALTASEQRVANMAASGMTNREIAQALFITMKTVAMHLTHTYEKLGIAGREQLHAALNPGARELGNAGV